MHQTIHPKPARIDWKRIAREEQELVSKLIACIEGIRHHHMEINTKAGRHWKKSHTVALCDEALRLKP